MSSTGHVVSDLARLVPKTVTHLTWEARKVLAELALEKVGCVVDVWPAGWTLAQRATARESGMQELRARGLFVPRLLIEDDDGGRVRCTLDQFIEANEDEETRDEVRKLGIGESTKFGGGAAPVFTVRRIS